MATKKWISAAIKHPGRCKHMGSKECPVGSPQYNLAKRFKSGEFNPGKRKRQRDRRDVKFY